jgi:hypothetical protein
MVMVVNNLPSSVEPPVELRRSRPRDVQLSAGGVFVTTLGALLFVGAVVVVIVLSRVSASQIREQRLLETTGVTTTARVTRLWRGSDDHKTPWVAYVYDAEGRTFDGRSKLRLFDWQSLRTGDSLDVRYVPGDPASHAALHEQADVVPSWLPAVAGVFLAACGLGCFMAVQMQRRLLSDGRIARATVTKITKRHTSHGGTYRSVSFTFPLLSGTTVAAKASTSRRAPDVGASVWVVYDPDNPKRNAMYPLQLVKVPRP